MIDPRHLRTCATADVFSPRSVVRRSWLELFCNMPHWVRVAELAEHPPGSAWECVVEDRIVALFNVEGEISALDGVCPHQGGPLGKGCLSGATVTCPWHGWQFDVRTGQSRLSRTIVQPKFAVRIAEGGVWVDLESGAATGA